MTEINQKEQVSVLEDTPARKLFLEGVRRARSLGILPNDKLA